jgi:hypothetical protein
MGDVALASIPSFCRDLHLFVRDFEVPKFKREAKKGYWFEERIIQYFDYDKARYEVLFITGDLQLLGISAASGLRHETDLLIESDSSLFLFEAKCKKNVDRNDLLIFNQKCLDYWIRFVQLDNVRPLYRIFVSKTNLEYPLREFAYMWNIILIEPELLPVPTIMGVLQDAEKCRDLEIYAADRHLAFLEKSCRDMGNLFRRDRSQLGVICLDTLDMPSKGNRQLSSDGMYLAHRQLSRKLSRRFFDRTSSGYENMISQIELQTGYTQEGKPK